MKPDLTVAEFCDRHDACEDGRAWALANCDSMQDAWGKARPDWLIWIAIQKHVLTDRELRLFAVASARQVIHLMKDERSRKTLDVAEAFANGKATAEELEVARREARAAWSAAWYDAAAAYAATYAAASAYAAAAYAADAASASAAAAAAYAADAASAAAWSAAADADAAYARRKQRDLQAAWLRENTKPNFKGEAR